MDFRTCFLLIGFEVLVKAGKFLTKSVYFSSVQLLQLFSY